MEIDINVNGSMRGMRPSEPGSGVSAERGSLVMIGFFLKDTLKVLGEESDVEMSQCYYEQKIVSMFASQVDDLDFVKQVAYQTLHADMNMHPQAAKIARSDCANTIRNLVQPTRATNTSLSTLLLEIHVECVVEKDATRRGNGPSGQHGYDRLVKRLEDEACSVCHNEFTSPCDIVITPCHHAYHRSCLFHWLHQGSHTCPMCRFDVALMVAGQLNFDGQLQVSVFDLQFWAMQSN